MDLKHIWKERYGINETVLIEKAIDLDEFYPNVEWAIMDVPAKKNIKLYPCCNEPYPDITFNITLRRQAKFYIINLLIPSVCINILTILGFYLPSDCGEKISLCISILLALTVFQLLLMELVPPTSLNTPLMGKYLMFTCFVVSADVLLSVLVLNVSFRTQFTHKMPQWMKYVFLKILPRLLLMQRPDEEDNNDDYEIDWSSAHSELSHYGNPYGQGFKPLSSASVNNSTEFEGNVSNKTHSLDFSKICEKCTHKQIRPFPQNVTRAIDGINFLAKHYRNYNQYTKVSNKIIHFNISVTYYE